MNSKGQKGRKTSSENIRDCPSFDQHKQNKQVLLNSNSSKKKKEKRKKINNNKTM